MKTVVFTGPTLSPQQIGHTPGIVCLPPAAQGDVYCAALSQPRCIGIIDGYFQGAPAVWHKEILWAMQQGIHVYGSASMGALRAAELAPFGMRGVGKVFQAYSNGSLIDDDEVALIHGPPESGYLAASEPLVNIRFTLEKAVHAGLLDQQRCDLLIAEMKSLFYWDRSYPALLQRAGQMLTDAAHCDLSSWLKTEAVDQKKKDALEMIEEMANAPDQPFTPKYQFEHTSSWEAFVVAYSENSLIEDGDDFARVINELRLDRELYCQMKHRAIAGLITPERRVEDPTDTGFSTFPNRLGEEFIGRIVLKNELIQQLAVAGKLQMLRQRAEDKHRFLAGRYGELPQFGDLMITPEQVFHWYFQAQRGQQAPNDLEAYAHASGFQNSGTFCRVLLYELLYQEGLKKS